MHWYLDVLRKYVVFEGRARRMEFWMFNLFSFIIVCVLSGIEVALGIFGLSALYSLAVLLPSLGVAVRRLHDTDRSGWWIFICLVPVIGIIILLIFYFMDGTAGDNRFGANPKEASA